MLFNNAGIHLPATPLEEIPLDQWQQIVAVNLTGTFLCMQEAFRMMQRQTPQGGRIINNGSISAHVPRPHAAGYNATKHAVTGLTQSGSLEGRKYHIAVGQIDIGNAETPMSSESLKKGAMQADGEIRQAPSVDVTYPKFGFCRCQLVACSKAQPILRAIASSSPRHMICKEVGRPLDEKPF